MYKIVATVITAGMIAVSGSILAQVPLKASMDKATAASKEQSKNEAAVKARAAAYKQEAPQTQPSTAQRNASFLVFLGFLYGRK